jgi:hypothetical protein
MAYAIAGADELRSAQFMQDPAASQSQENVDHMDPVGISESSEVNSPDPPLRDDLPDALQGLGMQSASLRAACAEVAEQMAEWRRQRCSERLAMLGKRTDAALESFAQALTCVDVVPLSGGTSVAVQAEEVDLCVHEETQFHNVTGPSCSQDAPVLPTLPCVALRLCRHLDALAGALRSLGDWHKWASETLTNQLEALEMEAEAGAEVIIQYSINVS